jgi:uncharacterized membrane protein YeiH
MSSDVSLVLALDLLGVFVFGLSGAMLAVRRGLDVFGILVLALAAALAGGMMRDVLLGAAPPAAFQDSRYPLAALAAGAVVFFAHRQIDRAARPVMVMDALGLGLFAVAGCRKALDFGLDPLPALGLGVLTAVGGGALRDLLVAEVPRVLREEVYALAALAGAAVVVAGRHFALPEVAVAVAGVVLAFAVRVISVWRGWSAPRAPGS